MSRPNIAARTGLARAAYEHALQYSSERQTFDSHSTNINTFVHAGRHEDEHRSCACSRGNQPPSTMRVSATESAAHAKRFAADMAMQVATDAVQIYGGYGFSENTVARLMRGQGDALRGFLSGPADDHRSRDHQRPLIVRPFLRLSSNCRFEPHRDARDLHPEALRQLLSLHPVIVLSLFNACGFLFVGCGFKQVVQRPEFIGFERSMWSSKSSYM